jgi:hypothetical protein
MSCQLVKLRVVSFDENGRPAQVAETLGIAEKNAIARSTLETPAISLADAREQGSQDPIFTKLAPIIPPRSLQEQRLGN